MEKNIVLIILTILYSASSNAQYKENKSKYDFKTYSYQAGDPHNPSAMAFASIVIPGFGEILEGEGKRGFPLLIGSISLKVIKTYVTFRSSPEMSYTNKDAIRKSILITQIGLRIFSAIDASRIAKVNNLAFRDKYNKDISLKVMPFCEEQTNYGISMVYPTGFTILVSF